MGVQVREIGTRDELRALLDELNDQGLWDVVAGQDANGVPFLAFLTGVYADGEGAYTYNPQDPDAPNPEGHEPCSECGAVDPLPLDQLRYPVKVIV